MTTPFTANEVKKAIKALKNNKSAGSDEIKAEQLKHGPEIINEGIATILNETAKTGKHPKEIKGGILPKPLPKPGNKKMTSWESKAYHSAKHDKKDTGNMHDRKNIHKTM